MLAQATGEGWWLIAPDSSTIYANPRMAVLVGQTEGQMYQVPATTYLTQGQSRVLITTDPTLALLASEPQLVHSSGAVVQTRAMSRTILDSTTGAPVGVLSVLTDVTDQRRMAEETRRRLGFDDLTGLPTRLMLSDRVAQQFALAGRYDVPFALLICDLSNFRFVNYTHNRLIGDQVLVRVAKRIVAASRGVDVVARVGGDEFAILLTDCADPAVALQFAQRLQHRLHQPFAIADQQCTVSTDIGIAMGTGAHTAEELMQTAWEAVYQVKEGEHQDRVGFYDETLRVRAMGRLAMLDGLRTALHRGELELRYQPMVDIATGTVGAVEALLRWRHPQRGLITPAQFLAVAEESGLIVDIGAWVIREACMVAAGWDRVAVHVNVAAYQLDHPTLIDDIDAALSDSGLDPALLTVEITESAVIRDVGRGRLDEVRGLGVRLAIDDFGTGYSSLAHLRRIPAHMLKIDRLFIVNLTGSAEDRAIIQAIRDLAAAIGMQVVAEGVETADQLAVLRELGFTWAQGLYWSEAVPADEVPDVIHHLAGPW